MSVLWTIPVIWQHSTVVIIGGGKSVTDVDLSLFNGHRVLAVNNAYELGAWDAMFFGDSAWYRWEHNVEGLKSFKGLKITNNVEYASINGIKAVRRGPKGMLSEDPAYMMWGGNSGLEAISLAYQLGSRRIILVGFDMKRIDGHDNFHNKHKRRIPVRLYEERFIPQFKRVAPLLAAKGVEVINCTPGSALDVFPIKPLKDVLCQVV